jgi:hypothetical protein
MLNVPNVLFFRWWFGFFLRNQNNSIAGIVIPADKREISS